MYNCKQCNLDFESKSAYAGHISNVHTGWSDERKNKIKSKIFDKYPKKIYDVICNKCSIHFKVEEYVHKFPNKTKYFCTRKCANSRTWTEFDKIKKSKAGKDSVKVKHEGYRKKINHSSSKVCANKNCNKSFLTTTKSKKKIL